MYNNDTHPLEKTFLGSVFFASKEIKTLVERTKDNLKGYEIFPHGLIVIAPFSEKLDLLITQISTIFQWATTAMNFAYYEVNSQEVEDLFNLSNALYREVGNLELIQEYLAMDYAFVRTDTYLIARLELLDDRVNTLTNKITEEKERLFS